jgi:hypothetical protein
VTIIDWLIDLFIWGKTPWNSSKLLSNYHYLLSPKWLQYKLLASVRKVQSIGVKVDDNEGYDDGLRTYGLHQFK